MNKVVKQPPEPAQQLPQLNEKQQQKGRAIQRNARKQAKCLLTAIIGVHRVNRMRDTEMRNLIIFTTLQKLLFYAVN